LFKSERNDEVRFILVFLLSISLIGISSTLVAKENKDMEESIRTNWDDESSIKDPRIQHLSYIFEETGESIPYALFVPSSYKKDKQISLIVSLHGLTRTYDWLMGYEGLLDLAEEFNFIVVTPLGYTRNGWYGSWSEGLDERSLEKEGLYSEKDVMNVLKLVRDNYSIDSNNIFLWGHSMGGAGTYHLGMKYPDLWKALALAAPAPPQVRTLEDLKIIQDIPILVLQGTKDRLVYPTREWVAEMKKLEMDFVYDEIKGADHSFFVSKNKENMRKIFKFFVENRN
jgi:predicted peptidase